MAAPGRCILTYSKNDRVPSNCSFPQSSLNPRNHRKNFFFFFFFFF